MILAADVGATKILMEAGDFRSGVWQPALARRYEIRDYANFHSVLADFLHEFEEVKPARARITAAGIGVAGPVMANKVKMTHRAWTIDGDSLGRRFGIARVRIVNDLAAAASGLEDLPASAMRTIQPGKSDPGAPRVVLGVGTGLGVAYLLPRADGFEVVPGEGGHVGFSPSSAEQAELWHAMFRTHGRVEAESLVSGMGLPNIYEFLRRRADVPTGAPEVPNAAAIHELARTKKEPLAIEALGLFAECLGNVAGDHALATMARGGVFLAGGVIAKLAPSIDVARLRAAFCAKGAFSAACMKIPVRIVTSEHLAVLGAARCAEK